MCLTQQWSHLAKGRNGFGGLLLAMLAVLVALATSNSAGGADRQEPGPGPLALTVVSAGKPVAGVTVRVGARYAVSAADGTAILDGVPTGRYDLTIEHPGFASLRKPLDLAAGTRPPQSIELEPSLLVRVRGKVVLETQGGPIAGAKVALVPTNVSASDRGSITFATAFDGSFDLLPIPAGMYRATVSASGCAEFGADLEVKPEMPEPAWSLKPVSRPARLTVNLRHELTGGPIPRGRVVLREAVGRGTIAQAEATDGKAVFEGLRVGPRNWENPRGALAVCRSAVFVEAQAEGFAAGFADVSLGAETAVNVELSPSAKINEREPNSDAATAQPIPANVPVAFRVDKPDDVDFFRVRIPYRSDVRVTVDKDNPLELIVKVYDSKGVERKAVGVARGEGLNLDLGGVRAGELLVSVEEWGRNDASPAPMTLRVETSPAGDPLEPNDTAAAARAIEPGSEVRGCLLPVGDVDWFRFEAARPGRVRVLMPPHPLQRWVQLRDAAGHELFAAGAESGQPLELQRQVGRGRYLLEVHEWADNAESPVAYALRLEMIEDDGIDDPTPGDGRAPVRRLEPGRLSSATIFPVGDVDLYTVSTPSAGRLHFEFTGPTELRGFVRARAGQLLADGASERGASGRAWCDVAGPQTLTLELHEWGDNDASPFPYQVRTRFEPCDEAESMGRNDAARSAIPTEFGEPLRGSILPLGDVDWYRLYVDHPGRLRFEGAGPTQLYLYLRDARRRTLTERGAEANAPLAFETPVLPGVHLIEVHEWLDNNASPVPYRLVPQLIRAEPAERVPLANDPVRPLKFGQAECFRIDQLGDIDRFNFDVPRAGKFFLHLRTPLELWLRLRDDRTGTLLLERGVDGGEDLRIPVEAKGATRYVLELREWNDNDYSREPSLVAVDWVARSFPLASAAATADAVEGTRVRVELTRVGKFPGADRWSLDADGDGRADVEAAGATLDYRYRAEGLYRAVALLHGADGSATRLPFWVESRGPQERTGVRLFVDHPAEDTAVETDEPVSVRAMSWSGRPIESVSLAIDGKRWGASHGEPHTFEIPWESLGAGRHVLTLSARDTGGARAETTRTVSVSDYFDLQPADGATVSGNAVRVAWRGAGFGDARVRHRLQGRSEWKDVAGERGRARSVLLADLEPGRVYEFQPLGGAEPGPVRTVTRVKGLAFSRAKYAARIERDYDQRVPVSVRNQSDRALQVTLVCGRPPEDSGLLAGFAGAGSEDAPFELRPGEERDILLVLSAQDCVRESVRFPVRIAATGTDGFADEAEIEVAVRLPTVNLEWQEVGATAELGKMLRIVNRGDALTDLDVIAAPGAAGVAPEASLSPAVRHALLPAGGSIQVIATPRLFEGFRSLRAELIARAVGKELRRPLEWSLPEGRQVYRVAVLPGIHTRAGAVGDKATVQALRLLAAEELDPAGLDWSRAEVLTSGDVPLRKRLRSVDGDIVWLGEDLDSNGTVDTVAADIGDDGLFEYAAYLDAGKWVPTNILEAWLEMEFRLPWGDRQMYEPHDADILFNGEVVGQLRQVLPEGTYRFRVPPRLLSHGGAEYSVGLNSRFLRGGHYLITSNFRLKMRLSGAAWWTTAGSTAEAAEAATAESSQLRMAEADWSVSSGQMAAVAPDGLQRGAPVRLQVPLRNVGALRPPRVTAALMLADPGRPPVELARADFDTPRGGGESPLGFEWKAAGGEHTLKIVVDPDNVSGDPDRSNNEAFVTLKIAGAKGNPAKPKLLEPADGAALPATVSPLRVIDEGGADILRAEARLDGGLWQPLSGSGPFAGTLLMQPGPHTVTVRLSDATGAATEASARVTVTAQGPPVEIVAPAANAELDARTTTVRIKVGTGAVLAAARSGGGPWRRIELRDAGGALDVPLRFGATTLEVFAADAAGTVRTATVAVTNRRQPQADEVEAPVPRGEGVLTIQGFGRTDLFAAPSQIRSESPAAPAGARVFPDRGPMFPVAARVFPAAVGVFPRIALALQPAPDAQAKPRTVIVEVSSPRSRFKQAPPPWKTVTGRSESPNKGLTDAEQNRRAAEAMADLHDGDVLVIGLHSNPNGFVDENEFLDWSRFHQRFPNRSGKPPKLRAVVIAGCMEGITPADLDRIREALGAEAVFCPNGAYGSWQFGLCSKITRKLMDGEDLTAVADFCQGSFFRASVSAAARKSKPGAAAPASGGTVEAVATASSSAGSYCPNRTRVSSVLPAPRGVMIGGTAGGNGRPGLLDALRSVLVRGETPAADETPPAKPENRGQLRDRLLQAAIDRALEELSALGVDADALRRFGDELDAQAAKANPGDAIPTFLLPPGKLPDPNDPEALQKWREAIRELAREWWLRQLARALETSDPRVIRSVLEAWGSAWEKWNATIRDAAERTAGTLRDASPLSAVPYPPTRGPSPEAVPKPSPFADPKYASPEQQEQLAQGQRAARSAVEAAKREGHRSQDGVFDQEFLKANPRLDNRLQEFEQGTSGQSLRGLNLDGKSAMEIHYLLIQKGFLYYQEPLTIRIHDGQRIYRCWNGDETVNENDPNCIRQDVYLNHRDGGMVRVKPEGDPRGVRPQPHASKSVVYDPAMGTGYENEAFKVTSEDVAVPKAPNARTGMKIRTKSEAEAKTYDDFIADQAHTNVKCP